MIPHFGIPFGLTFKAKLHHGVAGREQHPHPPRAPHAPHAPHNAPHAAHQVAVHPNEQPPWMQPPKRNRHWDHGMIGMGRCYWIDVDMDFHKMLCSVQVHKTYFTYVSGGFTVYGNIYKKSTVTRGSYTGII